MRFKDSNIGKIPVHWDVIKLGEVANVLSGYAFKRSDFVDKGVPVVKIKNIIPPSVNLDDVQFVNEDLACEKSKYNLKYNDILISLTGSNVNQMASAVGKVGRVRVKNKKLLLNQRVGKVFVDKEDLYDENFLFNYLSTEQTRYLLASSAGGSANQANISPKQIKELLLPYPPIAEQRYIGKILGLIDEKIELNQQIILNLEKLVRTLFKHWFIDFEFPNEKGLPYKSNGGAIVESELGGIPKGWKIGTAGELFEFSPTEKLSKGTISTYVEMKDLQDSAMVYHHTKREFKSGSKFRSGDTLLARITPCLENGKIGFVDFLEENELGWGSTEFIVIRTKENIQKSFSYFFVSEPTFKQYAIANMNGSSGRQRVKADTLAQYKLAIPPLKLIKKFTTISEANLKMMSNLKNQIIYLKELHNTIFPKLLSGEIKIPDEVVVE